jgi:hypothetical protein
LTIKRVVVVVVVLSKNKKKEKEKGLKAVYDLRVERRESLYDLCHHFRHFTTGPEKVLRLYIYSIFIVCACVCVCAAPSQQ